MLEFEGEHSAIPGAGQKDKRDHSPIPELHGIASGHRTDHGLDLLQQGIGLGQPRPGDASIPLGKAEIVGIMIRDP